MMHMCGNSFPRNLQIYIKGKTMVIEVLSYSNENKISFKNRITCSIHNSKKFSCAFEIKVACLYFASTLLNFNFRKNYFFLIKSMCKKLDIPQQ